MRFGEKPIELANRDENRSQSFWRVEVVCKRTIHGDSSLLHFSHKRSPSALCTQIRNRTFKMSEVSGSILSFVNSMERMKSLVDGLFAIINDRSIMSR